MRIDRATGREYPLYGAVDWQGYKCRHRHLSYVAAQKCADRGAQNWMMTGKVVALNATAAESIEEEAEAYRDAD